MSTLRATNAERLQRLASGGDSRTDAERDAERVFESAACLADSIDKVQDAESRMTFWGETLHYICARARMDWIETTGDDEMPLEGPTL